MEINAEKLSEFLYEKIEHHKDCLETYINAEDEYYNQNKYAQGYHTGCINTYEKIIKEFNFQCLF